MDNIPGRILRQARGRAGLSQRTLAGRSGTSQSVVARIELGTTSPTWATLERLVAAAGFTIDVQLDIAPVSGSHMLDDVARILALSVDQRLDEVANLSAFEASVRSG